MSDEQDVVLPTVPVELSFVDMSTLQLGLIALRTEIRQRTLEGAIIGEDDEDAFLHADVLLSRLKTEMLGLLDDIREPPANP